MKLLKSGVYGDIYKYDNDILKIFTSEVNTTEYDILFGMNSKYLVKGKSICERGGRFGVIMERLNPILSSTLHPKQIMYDLACGLKYLHDNNYVHLDITLNNCMCKNNAKLIDFSLSLKVTRDINGNIIPFFSNVDKITTSHRPYENILGSEIYSDKSDVWSLGIVFLEIYFSRNILDFCDFDKISVNGSTDWEESTKLFITKIVYQKIMRNYTSDRLFISLFENMLNPSYVKRFNIDDVLTHDFFNYADIPRAICCKKPKHIVTIKWVDKIIIAIEIIKSTCFDHFSYMPLPLLFYSIDLFISYCSKIDLFIEYIDNIAIACVLICYSLFMNESSINDYDIDLMILKKINYRFEILSNTITVITNINTYEKFVSFEELVEVYNNFLECPKENNVEKYVNLTGNEFIPGKIKKYFNMKFFKKHKTLV